MGQNALTLGLVFTEAEKQANFERQLDDLDIIDPLKTAPLRQRDSSPSIKSVYGIDEEIPSSARRDSDPISSPLGLLRKQGYHVATPPRSPSLEGQASQSPSPDSSVTSPLSLADTQQEQEQESR